jgi:hypothetical protein
LTVGEQNWIEPGLNSFNSWKIIGADIPIVSIECLELGKIAIEGGNISSSYTPESADLKDIACFPLSRYARKMD